MIAASWDHRRGIAAQSTSRPAFAVAMVLAIASFDMLHSIVAPYRYVYPVAVSAIPLLFLSPGYSVNPKWVAFLVCAVAAQVALSVASGAAAGQFLEIVFVLGALIAAFTISRGLQHPGPGVTGYFVAVASAASASGAILFYAVGASSYTSTILPFVALYAFLFASVYLPYSQVQAFWMITFLLILNAVAGTRAGVAGLLLGLLVAACGDRFFRLSVLGLLTLPALYGLLVLFVIDDHPLLDALEALSERFRLWGGYLERHLADGLLLPISPESLKEAKVGAGFTAEHTLHSTFYELLSGSGALLAFALLLVIYLQVRHAKTALQRTLLIAFLFRSIFEKMFIGFMLDAVFFSVLFRLAQLGQSKSQNRQTSYKALLSQSGGIADSLSPKAPERTRAD